MPIEPLTSGQNFKEDAKEKINAIIKWINEAENGKIIPDQAGKMRLPAGIDLSGFVTKNEARQAGLQV